jgi:hypothetical protein
MTNSEFSNEFDILYNNIMSNQAPGLDAYEKSVFLTKAQEDIVLAYYTGRNESGDYFEGSEEVRQYLFSLIRDYKYETPVTGKDSNTLIGISSKSKFFFLDLDGDTTGEYNEILAIVAEYVKTEEGKKVKVVPITVDEFLKIENNPFRGLSKSRVLKLDNSISAEHSDDTPYIGRVSELVTDCNISEYIIRVLIKPTPIILETLSGDLSINNKQEKTECMLHSSLHRKVLDRAVLLAKASFASNPGQ